MRRLLLTLVVVTLGTPHLAAQRAPRLPPAPWPPELGEAFELYYADEFVEVQRVCRQLSAETRDKRLRREAAALAAIATMRLPGRTDRLSGRAQLAQLAEQDASLLTRPECQLAYGIAQTALSETATALQHLNRAAETFASREQPDRLAETCVALAEAWVRHGEWELAVPGLEILRPENRAAADRIRAARIRAQRDRVAALPDCEAYVARINLLLARHLAETEEAAAEGLALLEELAHSEETTKAVAQACLALAERYEAERRWTDAARLYARVEAAGLGRLSRQAEQRRNAIQRPQLVLDVPGQVAVGQRVVVDLRARNLGAVEFEVRRVNLTGWLEQRQGRFAEAALPTSGALVAARNLDTALTTEHECWRSETLDEPLTFEAPAGALAVIARAVDVAGGSVTAKRLVLAGGLRASVFVGRRRAAVWAIPGEELEAALGAAEPQARFWMHGSFVPTRLELAKGVAVFALPPEARLLRDKRWVCVVQAGEQVALCRGRLPADADRQRKPAVALIGGPPEPRVGEQLHVFGLLLGGADDRLADRLPQTVELELLGTLDRVYTTTTAAVSNAGTFSARLPISAEMAGEYLRVAVRLDGQVLENVFSRLRVHVAQADATPLSVHWDLPPWLPPSETSIAGHIKATYPGGTPLSGGSAHARFRAVRLPAGQPEREPAQSDLFSRDFRLDRDGKCDFVQPLSNFNLPDGPLAVSLWADVAGWDDRRAQGSAQVLISPEPVHLWLGCQTDTPRVGEPLYVSVGWLDPTGRAAAARPTVAVWRAGAPLTNLQLLPASNGWRTAAWRPTAPGSYELVATLPLDTGRPATARSTIRVAGHRQTDEQDLEPLRYEARFARRQGRPHVRVQLTGQWPRPVLALLEAGDPLVARRLPPLDGATELLLPLTHRPRATTRLVLAAPSGEDVQILGVTEVTCSAEEPLTLSLSSDPSQTAPGVTVEISAACLRAGQPTEDATLVARLVDASRGGSVQWLPGEGRPDLALLPGGIRIVSSAAMDATADASGAAPDAIPETRELSAQLARALFAGPTLWVDSQASGDGAATFAVPLPAEPGSHRLVVMARTPDGAFAAETLDLDTRRGIRLTADIPEHLTLGDRSVASLTITNDEPAATRARITFEGGPGLHVDKLRVLDRQTRLEPSDDGTWFALMLPPSATVTLRAGIEAVQAGTATAALAVETERARHRATAAYTIHAWPAIDAEPPAAAGRTIAVRRSLFLLNKQVASEAEAFTAAGSQQRAQGGWQRAEVEPGARMSPGQLLLVREELSLEQPLSQVEWRQRLPGNCHTHAGSWSDLRRIGTQRELRLNGFTRDVTWLAAGRAHIHEYVIVAVRPGACRFPPPTARADGVPLGAAVNPPTQRVLVADSD